MSAGLRTTDRHGGNHRKFVIAALLTAITAISYLDRQTLSIVIGEVQREVSIDEVQFGRMTSMFLLGYALMYAGGGWLVDRLGVRLGYLLIAGGWSLACGAHALAQTAFGFTVARFCLGLTEGGGFPASAKAVSEWFQAKERSFAFGVINTGSAVGSMIAPPLIAAITIFWGWRAAFIAAGSVGLLLSAAWYCLYRPAAVSEVALSEAALSEAAGTTEPGREREWSAQAASPPVARDSWFSLFGIPEVRTLALARFLTGGPWFFMIFWFPKYLIDVWHFDTKQVGWYAWMPYAFAGVGSFAGGWFSWWLMQQGYGLDAARKMALAASALLLPAAILIAISPALSSSPAPAIGCACLAFLGHQSWSVIMHTLTTDLFPARLVGSAAGLIGMSEAAGSALFAEIVGRVLDATGRSYAIPFVVTGLLHPIAFVVIFCSIRKIDLLQRFRPPEAFSTSPIAVSVAGGSSL